MTRSIDRVKGCLSLLSQLVVELSKEDSTVEQRKDYRRHLQTIDNKDAMEIFAQRDNLLNDNGERYIV